MAYGTAKRDLSVCVDANQTALAVLLVVNREMMQCYSIFIDCAPDVEVSGGLRRSRTGSN